MKLRDLIGQPPPEPWVEGQTIPWNDPAFSARMLGEHLSQEHDMASRRFAKIDAHVAWIHKRLLRGKPASILDLCCGPGLYASRLARLGHTCLGIDYGPASIDYARREAETEGLACTYLLQDVRAAPFGAGYRLATLLFGELNVFPPDDARRILCKAHDALATRGMILIEPSTFAAIRDAALEPSTWSASASGLWSDRPHLCLIENHWHAPTSTHTTRFHIVDAATGEVTRHTASAQAYTDAAYVDLLGECGFTDVRMYPSLTGEPDPEQPSLLAIVARKS